MCGYSKEPSQCDGSFKHTKHMLKLIGKKIFTIFRSKCCLSKPVRVLTGSFYVCRKTLVLTTIGENSEGPYDTARS